MPVFGKCCCCDLKTGNIVLGCLCLIGALLNLGYAAYEINIANAGNQLGQYALIEALAEYGLTEEHKNILLMVSSCMDLMASIISIPTSICLIVGALKANRQLIAIYLVVEMVDIVLSFLKMAIIFFMFGFDYKVLIFCVYVATIAIFIWLFPLSLYQDLQNAVPRSSEFWCRQIDRRARSTADGQFDSAYYSVLTESYEPIPRSMTYPVQGQPYQPPPPYTQK